MSNESYETSLPETFDPATQEGTTFDVVPIGTYVAQIRDAEVFQPKTGDGHQIGLTWQITEGEYAGRYVWQRITFLHSNSQAMTIGRKQIKDLCDATGVSEQVTDVTVFKFIPCRIKVGIEKDKQGIYPDKNRVARILPLDAEAKSTPVQAKPTPVQAKPQTPNIKSEAKPATGNGPAKPWQKPKPSLSDEMSDEVPY
jgi:Protein of unknown function (DUF669)